MQWRTTYIDPCQPDSIPPPRLIHPQSISCQPSSSTEDSLAVCCAMGPRDHGGGLPRQPVGLEVSDPPCSLLALSADKPAASPSDIEAETGEDSVGPASRLGLRLPERLLRPSLTLIVLERVNGREMVCTERSPQ